MTSVRKHPSCPHVQQSAPASSKMDPSLAKADPISDGGSTCVRSYLRKGKKRCTTVAGQEE